VQIEVQIEVHRSARSARSSQEVHRSANSKPAPAADWRIYIKCWDDKTVSDLSCGRSSQVQVQVRCSVSSVEDEKFSV
jgi:hypothetical protein